MWVLACGYDGVCGEPRAGCAGHMLVLGQEVIEMGGGVLACGYDGVCGEPGSGCAGHMLVLGQEGGRVALLPPTHTGLK